MNGFSKFLLILATCFAKSFMKDYEQKERMKSYNQIKRNEYKPTVKKKVTVTPSITENKKPVEKALNTVIIEKDDVFDISGDIYTPVLLNRYPNNNNLIHYDFSEDKKLTVHTEKIGNTKIYMTEKEAVAFGFSYRKKSKNRIRITNYHGKSSVVVIPEKIGNYKVNEIGHDAFANNKTVKRIYIPETVKKIGERAFRQSVIKDCIIADGITVIKSYTFFCSGIKNIRLPKTLKIIEKSAFENCHQLFYIEFPERFTTVEDNAFKWSSLTAFGVESRDTIIQNGNAFYTTPLYRDYSIIKGSANKDCMYVLLIGYNAMVKFENKKMILCENSIIDGCFLDFSDVEHYPSVTSMAFSTMEHYRRGKIRIKVNKTFVLFYYPPYVEVITPDGTPYSYYKKERNGDTVTYSNAHMFYSYGITDNAKKIIIKPNGNGFIGENAVFSRTLESIELGRFDYFVSGEIFSIWCDNLHEVKWIEDDTIITKYIPPVKYVGYTVHHELLRAFSGNTWNWNNKKFFDRGIIDKMFRTGKVKYQWGNLNNTYCAELNQKEKILIAIDVLRSTNRERDGDVDMYRNYIRTHKRYAEILIRKYPEYDLDLSEFIE